MRNLVATLCLVTLAVVGFTSDARAFGCMGPGAMIVVVPQADEPLPLDLGVLVMAGQGGGTRSLGRVHQGDPTIEASSAPFAVGAELVQGTTHVALRVQTLAPGLARLVPVRPVSPGEWTLVRGTNVVPVRFGAPTLPAIPAAPGLRALISVHSATATGSSSTTSFSARLATGMPAGAIGMIVYVADSPTAESASLFAVLEDHSEAPVLATFGARCGFTPPGTREPPIGSSARVAWFDAFGRVSARSGSVNVRGQ